MLVAELVERRQAQLEEAMRAAAPLVERCEPSRQVNPFVDVAVLVEYLGEVDAAV